MPGDDAHLPRRCACTACAVIGGQNDVAEVRSFGLAYVGVERSAPTECVSRKS
jgi:hypothetical protein